MARAAWATALLFTFLVVVPARAVTVSKQDGGGASVEATGYRATVDAHGCLPHLLVGDEELLNSTVDVARGVYLFQNGRPDLDQLAIDAAAVAATSGAAELHYAFADDNLTVTATNKSAAPTSFFVVLDGGFRAAANDHGERVAAPTMADWTSATFYRNRAKLTVAGLDRIWGPWGNGLQVCEAVVKPGESRTLTLTPGTLTADEAKALAAMSAASWVPGQPVEVGPVTIWSPRDYQVVQRRTAKAGTVRVSGRTSADRVDVEVEADPPVRVTAVPVTAGCFDTSVQVPAGGWYKVLVGTSGPDPKTTATVDHVGVGEVFVIAGQSNSTNSGQFRTSPKSGLVASFSGSAWRLADDPQPGPHDRSTGGSPWPAFGDAMAAKYHVPIGIASTGHGGTSIKQWMPGGELFNWTEARLQQLGPGGFRAVLWHQGESDWGMSADEYDRRLSDVILSSQRAAGWAFPWFVAHASYHNPVDVADAAVRAGQAKLWSDGVALAGPDTDQFKADYRDHDGTGIHFSPKGLAAHGNAWADKVAAYLDPVLAAGDR